MRVLAICDQWKQGVCAAIPAPTYCPKERALYAGVGGVECTHHPDCTWRRYVVRVKHKMLRVKHRKEKA
jgi:hypothetical protein